MIIDPIINQVPKRTGVIGIVVLALVSLTAPLAAYLMSRRITKVDYSRVGKPIVNGSATIHSSIVWSIFIFIYSLMIFIGMISSEDLDFAMYFFFIIITFTTFGTAFCMFYYGRAYSNDIIKKSDILILHAKKYGIINANENMVEGKIKIQSAEINKYIKAFEIYGVMEFSGSLNGIYKVKKFNPLIEEYFVKAEMTGILEIPSEEYGKWTCRGCGAVNTLSKCPYCGSSKE